MQQNDRFHSAFYLRARYNKSTQTLMQSHVPQQGPSLYVSGDLARSTLLCVCGPCAKRAGFPQGNQFINQALQKPLLAHPSQILKTDRGPTTLQQEAQEGQVQTEGGGGREALKAPGSCLEIVNSRSTPTAWKPNTQLLTWVGFC